MSKINYLPILLIFFLACSLTPEVEVPEEIAELDNLTVIPADTEPSQTIDFSEEVIYGDTEEVMLGRIRGVTVDKVGRVFVADGDQKYIHAYASDGNYLAQVGSEGEGPGEFGNISRLKTDKEYLYAYDWNPRRANVFLLESLEFSHTISLQREDLDIEELSGSYPFVYYLRNDGNLLVGFNQPFRMNDTDEEEERMVLYYLMDKDGNIISDKIFEQKASDYIMDRTDNSMMVMSPTYGRKSLLSISDTNKLYSAWTEYFLIKVYNADGSYERAIYYPYSKSELDKSKILKDYEGARQRRMIRNDNTPPTWPALNSLTVDDKNRLWLSTITDDQDVYEWWVIDENGDLRARFNWPRNRSIQEIKNGVIYTKETDEKTGLEQVVRYSVEFI